jgi:hypothetical protein
MPDPRGIRDAPHPVGGSILHGVDFLAGVAVWRGCSVESTRTPFVAREPSTLRRCPSMCDLVSWVTINTSPRAERSGPP